MQNLRDKLLKAGLITEADKKSADAETARPRPRPDERPRGGDRPRPSGDRPRGGGGGGANARPAGAGRPSGGGPRGGERRENRGAPIPKLPPLAVPNNKEFQRLEAKKQLELDRRIRELVLATQVPVEAGERTFYFVTRKNRLRRLELSDAQAALLESGQLAVVERPEAAQIEHSLVPPETAKQLLEWQPKSVRFFNRSEEPVGFLSDEELSRRQKVEADRVARGDKDDATSTSEEGTPAPEGGAEVREHTATTPDDSDEAATTEAAASASEDLAATAERIAADVPSGDESNS